MQSAQANLQLIIPCQQTGKARLISLLHDLEQNHDQNVAATEAFDIVPHNKLLYKLGIEGMFKLGMHLSL